MSKIYLRDLADEPMTFPDAATGHRIHAQFMEAWSAVGLQPNVIAETQTRETVMNAVASGLALGFVTENTVPPSTVVMKWVEDFNVELDLAFVWKIGSTSPALKTFTRLMERQLKLRRHRPDLRL